MSRTDCEATADHYGTLNVPRNATYETIKAAYHKAARKVHPDKSASSATTCAEPFLSLQAAWECLSDSERRKAYDESLDRIIYSNRSRRMNATVVTLEECTQPSDDDLIYTCRCGHDINIALCDDDIVHCSGCSLEYDVSHLFVEEESGSRSTA